MPAFKLKITKTYYSYCLFGLNLIFMLCWDFEAQYSCRDTIQGASVINNVVGYDASTSRDAYGRFFDEKSLTHASGSLIPIQISRKSEFSNWGNFYHQEIFLVCSPEQFNLIRWNPKNAGKKFRSPTDLRKFEKIIKFCSSRLKFWWNWAYIPQFCPVLGPLRSGYPSGVTCHWC